MSESRKCLDPLVIYIYNIMIFTLMSKKGLRLHTCAEKEMLFYSIDIQVLCVVCLCVSGV